MIMQTWIDAVRKELGISVDFDVNAILDIARDAAHGVERPAAPVTTFLLGYAVGRGADLEASTAKISSLANSWSDKE
jgi:hypothetical protein